MSDSITETRLLIGALLVAFLLLSLASSVFVVRALQGQIDNFLQAARKLGSGDLSERVPVQGDDEFAALGREFNTMAEQLEAHIDEVERKRRELEESIRRIGEAFGTGLDRQGLVDLAVRTAIEACDAEAGRMLPVDPRELEEVRIVDDPVLLKALEAAERQVLVPNASAEPAQGALEGVHALAMPIVGRYGDEGEGDTIGALSIARRGSAFSIEQCDLLAYLTTQTAVSLENADLHRRVQRQAITDELTGSRTCATSTTCSTKRSSAPSGSTTTSGW
jgi:HAMP domain-containing protein